MSAWVLISLTMRQGMAALRGLRIILFLHPARLVFLGSGVRFFNGPRIRLGSGVRIGDHAYLSGLGTGRLTIGDHSSIGAFSRVCISTTFDHVGSHIKIGKFVGIGEFASIGGAGGVEIGDETIAGSHLSIHPENHNFDDLDRPIRLQGVTRQGISIGSNCWLGAKVTFLDGSRIGNNCVVAAGAVVRGVFPDNVVIGGVPARILRYRRQAC